MKTYSFLQPTISQKSGIFNIKIAGSSVKELFAAALEALNRALNKNYEDDFNQHTALQEISVTAQDLNSLLLYFLSEVLEISKTKKVIFHNIDLMAFENDGNGIHAHLLGVSIHRFMKNIQNVSYQNGLIEKNKNGNFEANLVFTV